MGAEKTSLLGTLSFTNRYRPGTFLILIVIRSKLEGSISGYPFRAENKAEETRKKEGENRGRKT